MDSRVKKYYEKDIEVENSLSHSTRSSRNANLYKHIYGKYEDLDNLPLGDNTNEIDIEKLKELVLNSEPTKEEKQLKENLNILEQRKRQIDERKLYDINKILEKAKYENSKLKDNVSTTSKYKKDILSTLESTELSLEEINNAKKAYQEKISEIQSKQQNIDDELSMTREMKYKNLNLEQQEEDPESKTLNTTNSLSLDLFEDLKPTENTITTKPIKSELSHNTIKSDIHSGDTSDIDIIKTIPNVNSEEFFTNSFEFSKKDFTDCDDEFFEQPKKGGLFKILLLVLAIFVFIGVIIYFVGTYGLGIS